jgi:predicted Zn-dependent protease
LTRFANNTIHQNVAERAGDVSIRALWDGRTARASTNRFDKKAVAEATAQAIQLTRATDRDDTLLPLAEPVAINPVNRFASSTAECGPRERAAGVAAAIAEVEGAGQTAAGIYSTDSAEEALFNSRGVNAWHQETLTRFSITARAADSSGWAKASAVDRGAINAVALARQAAEKALRSANPREVPPGRYTVILEPAAVLDLVGQMFGDFSATALTDQRSFLTERLGTQLFGQNITIDDEVFHPLQSGPPFDFEGVPRRRVRLVDRGTPVEVVYSRGAAHRAGREATGHGLPLPNEVGEMPLNLVIAGGDTSVSRMIESTRRGLLVTRFWYIREVDPYDKIMTGMTRDGTFLIEDGAIVGGVRNLRFNQGLVEMLRNVEALSASVRASGEEAFDMVVPAMKVHEFLFTEVTRF